MARVLSQDLIFNTCTIEVFIISMLPCFSAYNNTDMTVDKVALLLISFVGFAIIFQ